MPTCRALKDEVEAASREIRKKAQDLATQLEIMSNERDSLDRKHAHAVEQLARLKVRDGSYGAVVYPFKGHRNTQEERALLENELTSWKKKSSNMKKERVCLLPTFCLSLSPPSVSHSPNVV